MALRRRPAALAAGTGVRLTALTSRKAAELHRSGLRQVCLTDVYGFARQILGYTDMTKSFHQGIARFLQTTPHKRNLFMVPRGFFKTSLFIALNIQRILRNPGIRILIASNKAENAEAILTEIKGHLQNPILIDLFPDVLHKDPVKQADVWTTSRIAVKTSKQRREPTITTIGLHGELTGRHYDHGTFDDLVGLENSQTREERQKTIAWWQAAQSLLDPGSTEDIVGTPWDWDDLYAWLLVQKNKHGMPLGVYERACWEPADLTEPGAKDVPGFGIVKPTFPERFPVPELERIKKEAGSTRFAAQYLLTPVDEETAVFPLSRAVKMSRDDARWPRPEDLWIVACLDPAISTKGWADYSAFAIVGFDHQNTMWVLHLNRGRWKESDVIAEVYAGYARYRPTAIGIEAIGFQKMFFHLFQREAEQRNQYLPLVKLERDTKITKNTRIRVLEPLWTAGQIVLADDLPVVDEFLEEASRFRLTKESTHDDMLDALADCLQLRVRPPARDPIAAEVAQLSPEDADRRRFEVTAQQARSDAGAGPLDARSLRMAWLIRQRQERFEEDRQTVVAGYGEEF